MAKNISADKIDPFEVVKIDLIDGIPEREKKTDHGIITGPSRIGKGQKAINDMCRYFPKRTVIIDPVGSWRIKSNDLPSGIKPEIRKFRKVSSLIAALDKKQKQIISAELLARRTGKKVPKNLYYFIYRLVNPNPDRIMLEHLYAKILEIGHIQLYCDESKRYISKYLTTEKMIYAYNTERKRIEKRTSLFNDIISSGSHACVSTTLISTNILDFPSFIRDDISYIKLFSQGTEDDAAEASKYFTRVERAKYGAKGKGLLDLKWPDPPRTTIGDCVEIWYRDVPGYSSNQMAPGYRY